MGVLARRRVRRQFREVVSAEVEGVRPSVEKASRQVDGDMRRMEHEPSVSSSTSGAPSGGSRRWSWRWTRTLSTKHLSFVETGRSRPSRQLLVHLAQHLDLPIAERNRLLLAGGFAPPYLEQPFDGDMMRPLRESLSRLLEAHEPNPALIVDGL